MEEYLRLNAELASYRPLTLEELSYENLVEKYDVAHLTTPQSIDRFIYQEVERLKNYLQSFGFDMAYVEPLFLKNEVFKESLELTNETDLEIVERYNQTWMCEPAQEFAAMEIDFYYLERFVRTHAHGEFRGYGSIDKEMYDRYKTIDALVLHSPYYDLLKGLNHKNIEQKFDETQVLVMQKYMSEKLGVNGIFAKTYFKLLDLKNIKIVLKGQLYGVNVQKIVRNAYV